MKNKTYERAQAIIDNERRKRAKSIMMRLSKGHAMTAIAKDLGISHQRVSAIAAAERAKAGA